VLQGIRKLAVQKDLRDKELLGLIESFGQNVASQDEKSKVSTFVCESE
jgi:hypothetical protein